jgi:hypothetical protein
VLTGFLPPEDGTGRGQGYFSFTVEPKAGLVTGTEIRNVALISFDGQTLISTDQIDPLNSSAGVDASRQALVTIDAGRPSSSVAAMPPTSPGQFVVEWASQDDIGGSGVGSYDVYVSDNGGPFTLWQDNIAQSNAMYSGQQGHTYAFYTVAEDKVGNAEDAPAIADATTFVADGTPPTVTAAEYAGRTPIAVPGLQYLTVTFSEDVRPSLGLNDFTVRNITTALDVTPASFQYDAASNTAVLTFAALPDGNYVVTVLAGGVADVAGNLMAADFTASFFELLGDVDRDRDVDQTDLNAVTSALGTPGVRPQDGDANADHKVDFADLVALAQNYNKEGTTLQQGDFNSDGKTDFADLVALAQHYNLSGRADVNRDGIVDEADVALVQANLGRTLPAPTPVPATASAAEAPVLTASQKQTIAIVNQLRSAVPKPVARQRESSRTILQTARPSIAPIKRRIATSVRPSAAPKLLAMPTFSSVPIRRRPQQTPHERSPLLA